MNLDQPLKYKSAETDQLVQAGIAAAKAGQRQQAREMLLRATDMDETNITAWLWLSGVVETRDDKEACLENILTLDPGHTLARQGLALLQKQAAGPPDNLPSPDVSPPQLPPPEPEPPPLPPPPPPVAAPTPPGRPTQQPASRTITSSYPRLSPNPQARQSDSLKPGHLRQHASIAASILQPGFAARQKPADENEGDSPPDAFANEYMCPYCAQHTRPDDRRCSACGHKLWIHIPRRPKPSRLYRFLTWNVGFNVAIGLYMIGLILFVSFSEPTRPALSEIFLRLVLPVFNTACYAVILIGYIKRWPILYYLNVIGAFLVMTGAGVLGLTLGLTSYSGMFCGGSLFFVGVVWFLMILSLGEDFAFDKYRLILRVDPDVKTGQNIFYRGNQYGQRKMWAMAAMHYRRAAGQMPNDINCHLALALAYLNLSMYDRAAEALSAARSISSIDPLLQKLTLQLERQRAA